MQMFLRTGIKTCSTGGRKKRTTPAKCLLFPSVLSVALALNISRVFKIEDKACDIRNLNSTAPPLPKRYRKHLRDVAPTAMKSHSSPAHCFVEVDFIFNSIFVRVAIGSAFFWLVMFVLSIEVMCSLFGVSMSVLRVAWSDCPP